MLKLTTRILCGVAAVLPFAALAQNADGDVVRIDAGATVERQSNVFLLAPGTDPTTLFGSSNRSDSILRGRLGLSFDREISLQRLQADVRIDPTKFFHYSKFDFVGYNGGLNLNWAVTQTVYGTIGVRATQGLTSFISTSTFVGERNLERRTKVYATAGVKITPNWSIIGGVDQTKLDNSLSLPFFVAANNTLTGTEAGLRYAPGTGNEFSVVARNTKGAYPNLQNTDSLGATLPVGVDNSFKQNAILFRLQQAPSEDTRFAGEIGYTKRNYDTVPSRDFSGVTALLSAQWKPSGAFTMRVELARDIGSPLFLTSNYVDLTELRLLPTIQLTGKLALTGRATFATAAYKGDPGLVNSTGPSRKDDLQTVGATLAYEYARNISLTADVRHERRTSNYDAFRFDNTIIGAGVLARF